MFEADADDTITKMIIGHKIDDITKGVYTDISLDIKKKRARLLRLLPCISYHIWYYSKSIFKIQ